MQQQQKSQLFFLILYFPLGEYGMFHSQSFTDAHCYSLSSFLPFLFVRSVKQKKEHTDQNKMKNTLLCTNTFAGILNKYMNFGAVYEVLSQKVQGTFHLTVFRHLIFLKLFVKSVAIIFHLCTYSAFTFKQMQKT